MIPSLAYPIKRRKNGISEVIFTISKVVREHGARNIELFKNAISRTTTTMTFCFEFPVPCYYILMRRIPDRIIAISFLLLFVVTPLLLTPYNYELFEFNKTLFLYGMTVIIGAAWLIRSILLQSFSIPKTPLTIPLLAFFAMQLAATLLSIDPYQSIWGYYGRFHGGLLSILSYIVLYFAFVSTNKNDELRIHRLLNAALLSGMVVSLYGILQHFGIDDHLWAQDVKNRVFSTLGQPNWLAAYVTILLPVSAAYLSMSLEKNNIIKSILYSVLYIIFTITLLYTKSRSGFIAAYTGMGLFWLLSVIPVFQQRAINKFRSAVFSSIGIQVVLMVMLTILIGSPFPQINILFSRSTDSEQQMSNAVSPDSDVLNAEENIDQITGSDEQTAHSEQLIANSELRITDSGDIRAIVWKGAVNAVRERPYVGFGPETFAWIYYRHRPAEHNLTSEWDFLYNKAHNEYLNYATTSGLLGLGTYVLIIAVFIGWFTKISNFKPSSRAQVEGFLISNQIPSSKSKINKTRGKLIEHVSHIGHLGIGNSLGQLDKLEIRILLAGLFSGWFSILITNFFGFSVVVTDLFFFLIPAMCFNLAVKNKSEIPTSNFKSLFQFPTSNFQILNSQLRIALTIIIIASGLYLLYGIGTYWLADVKYADATMHEGYGRYELASSGIIDAIAIRPIEPTYHNLASEIWASQAVVLASEGDATGSAGLIERSLVSSAHALRIAPVNVSFWKTRTRLLYTLSQLDPSYLNGARDSIDVAMRLAPTDAKTWYNAGLLYNATDDNARAIELLLHTIELKPNYRDAAWALALFYEEEENIAQRDEWLRYILEKINPDDEEAKRKLGS